MGSVEIISLVTIIVAWILGLLAKKSSFISNELIPIQNLIVGLTVAIIEWIITKNLDTAIALSGIIAGGTYDIFHNLEKIVKNEV